MGTAQQHREPERALSAVVGGLDAGGFGEVPQRRPEVQERGAEAAGALVTHPGALLEPVHQAVVQAEQLGLVSGDEAAVGLVGAVGGEDFCSGLLELSAEPTDPVARSARA